MIFSWSEDFLSRTSTSSCRVLLSATALTRSAFTTCCSLAIWVMSSDSALISDCEVFTSSCRWVLSECSLLHWLKIESYSPLKDLKDSSISLILI